MHKKNENGVLRAFLEKKVSFSKILCIEKKINSIVKKV
jgi:IS30 family transposase